MKRLNLLGNLPERKSHRKRKTNQQETDRTLLLSAKVRFAHDRVKRHGRDRYGNQRHRCKDCGKTWVEKRLKPLGDMRIPIPRAALCLKLLMAKTLPKHAIYREFLNPSRREYAACWTSALPPTKSASGSSVLLPASSPGKRPKKESTGSKRRWRRSGPKKRP